MVEPGVGVRPILPVGGTARLTGKIMHIRLKNNYFRINGRKQPLLSKVFCTRSYNYSISLFLYIKNQQFFRYATTNILHLWIETRNICDDLAFASQFLSSLVRTRLIVDDLAYSSHFLSSLVRTRLTADDLAYSCQFLSSLVRTRLVADDLANYSDYLSSFDRNKLIAYDLAYSCY